MSDKKDNIQKKEDHDELHAQNSSKQSKEEFERIKKWIEERRAVLENPKNNSINMGSQKKNDSSE
ncbi:MAG: hypothetical protein GX115_03685 [Ruminiclostridium sp.]|nr:hypothetical protein [Ruminiclostridium sp.]